MRVGRTSRVGILVSPWPGCLLDVLPPQGALAGPRTAARRPGRAWSCRQKARQNPPIVALRRSLEHVDDLLQGPILSPPKWQASYSPSLVRSALAATRTTRPTQAVVSPAVNSLPGLLPVPGRRPLSNRASSRPHPWPQPRPRTGWSPPRSPRRAPLPRSGLPSVPPTRRARQCRRQPTAPRRQSRPSRPRSPASRLQCAPAPRSRLPTNPAPAAPTWHARPPSGPLRRRRPRGLLGQHRWPTALFPPPRPSRPRRRRGCALARAFPPALRHLFFSPRSAPLRPPGWPARGQARHSRLTERLRQVRCRTSSG